MGAVSFLVQKGMGFLTYILSLLGWRFGRPTPLPIPPESPKTPLIPPVTPPLAPISNNREKLLEIAKSFLGKDASPKNLAPREVSCAEGVSNIIGQLFPDFDDQIVSTVELDYELDRSPYFRATKLPKAGNVIVSPRTKQQYGHAGIFLSDSRIASNNSMSGLFQNNYSLDEWIKEMREKRGLRIYFYEAAG